MTKRASKLNINSQKTNVDDIVTVYDKKVSRHFWRIAIVKGYYLVDSEIRGAIVRITKTNTILKHLVNKLFLIGNTYPGKGTKVKERSSRNWWTKEKIRMLTAWISGGPWTLQI